MESAERKTNPYAVAVGVCAALFMLYLARRVLLPFAIAFTLAYLMDPLVDRLEKLKVSRTLAVILLLLGFFSLALSAGFILVPILQFQVHHLVENLPDYIGALQSWIKPFLDKVMGLDAQHIQQILNAGMRKFGELPLKLVSDVSALVWGSVSGLFNVVLLIFNVVIIPVAGFYLLRDYDRITVKIDGLIPPRHRRKVEGLVREIDGVLANFVRGQLMVAFLMASLYGIGLYLCGTPLSLLIGLVAGIANLVPYLGLVLGLVPAALLTFLQYRDVAHLLAVVGVFAVAQALEGMVITPRIVGDKIGLHPVAIMLSVLLGAEFFGFLGVLLAVPSSAVLNVLLARGLTRYKNSAFYG
jgi:predicted PurR-regulated permease PerM